MNKQDYLRKKGLLPEVDNLGVIYVVTNEGYGDDIKTIFSEFPVWKKFGNSYFYRKYENNEHLTEIIIDSFLRYTIEYGCETPNIYYFLDKQDALEKYEEETQKLEDYIWYNTKSLNDVLYKLELIQNKVNTIYDNGYSLESNDNQVVLIDKLINVCNNLHNEIKYLKLHIIEDTKKVYPARG